MTQAKTEPETLDFEGFTFSVGLTSGAQGHLEVVLATRSAWERAATSQQQGWSVQNCDDPDRLLAVRLTF